MAQSSAFFHSSSSNCHQRTYCRRTDSAQLQRRGRIRLASVFPRVGEKPRPNVTLAPGFRSLHYSHHRLSSRLPAHRTLPPRTSFSSLALSALCRSASRLPSDGNRPTSARAAAGSSSGSGSGVHRRPQPGRSSSSLDAESAKNPAHPHRRRHRCSPRVSFNDGVAAAGPSASSDVWSSAAAWGGDGGGGGGGDLRGDAGRRSRGAAGTSSITGMGSPGRRQQIEILPRDPLLVDDLEELFLASGDRADADDRDNAGSGSMLAAGTRGPVTGAWASDEKRLRRRRERRQRANDVAERDGNASLQAQIVEKMLVEAEEEAREVAKDSFGLLRRESADQALVLMEVADTDSDDDCGDNEGFVTARSSFAEDASRRGEERAVPSTAASQISSMNVNGSVKGASAAQLAEEQRRLEASGQVAGKEVVEALREVSISAAIKGATGTTLATSGRAQSLERAETSAVSSTLPLAAVSSHSGRRVMRFVAAWDALSSRLSPEVSNSSSAQMVLAALKLVVQVAGSSSWDDVPTLQPMDRAQQQGAVEGSGVDVQRALGVALILADLKMGAEVVAAGLLREAVVQGVVSTVAVASSCGQEVVALLEDCTRLQRLPRRLDTMDDAAAAAARKFCLTFHDARAVVVELASCLDRMRRISPPTLPSPSAPSLSQCEFMPPSYASRSARPRLQLQALEALQVWAPLAHTLGLGSAMWELEDAAFRALFPRSYQSMSSWLGERWKDSGADAVAGFRTQLQEALEADEDLQGLVEKLEVQGRCKSLYSMMRKILRDGRLRGEVHDLLALRVIVHPKAPETTSSASSSGMRACYRVQEVASSLWEEVRERRKDYISSPKRNGYQSLHMAVRPDPEDPSGLVELQIRTAAMHADAEGGQAAHAAYKGGLTGGAQQLGELLEFMRTMSAAIDQFKQQSKSSLAGTSRSSSSSSSGSSVLQLGLYQTEPPASYLVDGSTTTSPDASAGSRFAEESGSAVNGGGSNARAQAEVSSNQVFQMLDLNGDGSISVAEIQRLMEDLEGASGVALAGGEGSLSSGGLGGEKEQEAAQLVSLMDANTDGVVSPAEFAEFQRQVRLLDVMRARDQQFERELLSHNSTSDSSSPSAEISTLVGQSESNKLEGVLKEGAGDEQGKELQLMWLGSESGESSEDEGASAALWSKVVANRTQLVAPAQGDDRTAGDWNKEDSLALSAAEGSLASVVKLALPQLQGPPRPSTLSMQPQSSAAGPPSHALSPTATANEVVAGASATASAADVSVLNSPVNGLEAPSPAAPEAVSSAAGGIDVSTADNSDVEDLRMARLDRLLAMARRKMATGSKEGFRDTRLLLHSLLKQHPDHPDVHVHLAQLERKAGDVREARSWYERGVRLFEASAAADSGRGMTYVRALQAWGTLEAKEGQLQQARRLFERSLEAAVQLRRREGSASPSVAAEVAAGMAVGLHAWAMLERREGNWAAARALLEQAERAQPNNAVVLQSRALLEAEAHHWGMARSFFKRAVEAAPDDAACWQAWALFEAARGKRMRMRQLFARALAAQPSNVQTFQAWALEEARTGSPDSMHLARGLFRRCTEINPKSIHAWQAWAVVEHRAGNLEEARRLFEECRRLVPASVPSLHAYALLERDAGNEKKARELLSLALGSEPMNAAALMTAAQLESTVNPVLAGDLYVRKGLADKVQSRRRKRVFTSAKEVRREHREHELKQKQQQQQQQTQTQRRVGFSEHQARREHRKAADVEVVGGISRFRQMQQQQVQEREQWQVQQQQREWWELGGAHQHLGQEQPAKHAQKMVASVPNGAIEGEGERSGTWEQEEADADLAMKRPLPPTALAHGNGRSLDQSRRHRRRGLAVSGAARQTSTWRSLGVARNEDAEDDI